jgi:hypothetical protein
MTMCAPPVGLDVRAVRHHVHQLFLKSLSMNKILCTLCCMLWHALAHLKSKYGPDRPDAKRLQTKQRYDILSYESTVAKERWGVHVRPSPSPDKRYSRGRSAPRGTRCLLDRRASRREQITTWSRPDAPEAIAKCQGPWSRRCLCSTSLATAQNPQHS